MSIENLVTLFFTHDGNVVDKWEQYLSIYASEFARFLNAGKPVRLLEIGVQNGGSLELWSKYFPDGSEIVGLDIDPAVEKIQFDRPIKVVVADVKNIERRELLLGTGQFDIIIDDGSHRSDDIIQAFRSLFDKLQPGGVYIVEDLHASYWESFGGGFRHAGSAIEFFKDVIDSLGIDHLESNASISRLQLEELQYFGKWIDRVVFYDSVVVIQKRSSEKNQRYRRMLSGKVSAVTDPADGLLVAPPAMARNIMLGAGTSQMLHEELLRRLIAELGVQAELRASMEKLQAELKAQATAHELNLEIFRREIDQLREEAGRRLEDRERERNDWLVEKNALIASIAKENLIATEVKALEANIDRLSDEQHAVVLALEQANFERDALLQTASWRLTSPLRSGYEFVKATERRIRRRLKPARPAEALEALPARAEEPHDEALSTPVEDEQLIAGSDLFDVEWYRAQVGGDPLANPVRHYFTRGVAAGLDPNPLFDTSWYIEQYADVRESGANPLVHYLKYGAAEGRDPNPFFDSDWYLEQNEDVKKAGINPLRHYLMHGDAEGRPPSEKFNSRWYRENYLKEQDQNLNALDHYIRLGRAADYGMRSADEDYHLQILRQEQMFVAELSEIEQHIAAMVLRPHFFIVINGDDLLLRRETEKSLRDQVYPVWLLASPLSAAEGLVESENSPWIFIELQAGDRMHTAALYAFASIVNSDPTVDLIYADDDRLDESGARTKPFFKPDWSPDYLESMNYIGPSACFRWNLVKPLLQQGLSGYDLVLRTAEVAKNIRHVRRILFHRRHSEMSARPEDIQQDIQALQARLRRTNRFGEIQPVLPGCRCYDCKINLSSTPLVSVIIPTAGKSVNFEGRSIDLLINCLDTIAARSTYKRLEFIIVDNGDLNSSQRSRLKYHGAKSITFREPNFNVSKKLNLGASIATGEFLLLLNDDIEPLSSDWIERLIEHFEKDHVGIVGAKLLYQDETTQHVGVVLNSCNPDHVRRLKPRGDLGYYFSTAAVRNFTAVTGACMMTRASLYRAIGGYCESLAISYNDADYCLRVIESNYTVVYAPRAELIHFESQSRQAELNPDESEYFHSRWAHVVSDPFYNELELTVASPTFEVQHNPRVI
jgi:GT2 family glycosyltransferase/SAM-dependent methyltransferase